MRLTSKSLSRGGRDARASRDARSLGSSLASLGSIGSFGARRSSARSADMNALITLSKRDSVADRASPGLPNDDDVTMSAAGQKVIPATFKLVHMDGRHSPDPSANDAFDQAGGHDGSFKTDGPTLIKSVTDREASFYEAAEEGAWPPELLPKFHGRLSDDAIKIENLTHGFAKPCVIDLKMGVQTVEDDESSILKKLKMSTLDFLTKSKYVGCRLEGLSMYRTLENRRIKGTKAQSHTISANIRVSLQDVLTFFLTDESGVRTDIALRFQKMVENILDQFQKNDKFRFIGSSILLIYDNDNCAPYMHWARALRKLHLIDPTIRLSEDQISGLTRRTRIDVRMIDFAHTGPMPDGMARDEGYITGLHTIINALKAIRTYRAKPIFSLASAVVDVMEEQRALAKSNSETDGGSKPDEFTFDTLLGELTPLAEGPPSPPECITATPLDSEAQGASSAGPPS